MKHRSFIIILLMFVSVSTAAAQSTVNYVETARIGRGKVSELFWSPDGETLAATTARGIWFYQADNLTLPPRLIEIDTEPILGEIARPLFRYPVVAFDSSWQRVAIDEHQRGVTIRNVATGEILARLTRDHDRIYQAFAFSPDGKTLAASVSGTTGFDIDFYDSETGALLYTLSNPDEYAAALMRYTPNGDYLLVGGLFSAADVGGANFYILNAVSGEVVYGSASVWEPMPLPQLDSPPIIRILSPYNFLETSLVLGSPSEAFALRFAGDSATFALNSDGSRYLTYDDGNLLLKKSETDMLLSEFPYNGIVRQPPPVAFDPTDNRVAYVDARNYLFVVSPFLTGDYDRGCLFRNPYCLTATDAHSMTIPELMTQLNNTGSSIRPNRYASPDGRWQVALGSQPNNIVKIKRLEDGEIFSLDLGDPIPLLNSSEEGAPRTEAPSNPFVVAANASPNGRWIALAFTTGYHGGSADRVVRVYDISGDEPIAEPVAILQHNVSLLSPLAFSADSQTLASSDWNNRVLLWDTSDWVQIGELIHTNQVKDLTFTESGDLLTWDADGILHIWSAQ